MIRNGAAASGVLGLADLLRARAASTPAEGLASVILVWLPGGPSHMETYDLKPDSPAAYRGEFRSIATKLLEVAPVG